MLCSKTLGDFLQVTQDIQIESQLLTQENKLKYLVFIVTNNRQEIDLDTQTSNVSKAFGGRMEWIWLYRTLSIKTKCVEYHAIVLSTFLDHAETWTLYKMDAQILLVYLMRQLNSILNFNC